MAFRSALFFLVWLSAAAAQADDATALCTRASRNAGIFELSPAGSDASAGHCTWIFAGRASADGDLVVELTIGSMKSEAAARLAIETARMPENHRGKTIEALPKIGDGGNLLVTLEDGTPRLIEIEAVKGRNRFLLTVRSQSRASLSTGLTWQSISFLGGALAQF